MTTRRDLTEAHLPKRIWYDMNILLQTTDGLNDRVSPLSFSEERGSAVVQAAERYTMSITRFQIDTQTLAVWIPEILPGSTQTDRDKMINTVNIDYDDGAGTITVVPATHLIFTQRDFYSTPPLPPSSNSPNFTQLINTTYYNSYSYQHLIEITNTALQTAMAAIITATGGGASPLFGVDPPVAYWNSSNDKMEIRARSDIFDSSLTAQASLYFNRPMYAMLPNFNVLKNNFSITEKRNYKILFNSNSGLSVEPNFFGGFDGIMTTQEYSDLSVLCPYSSLVFTSGTLPIIINQMSAPYIFKDGNLQQIFNTVANTSLIISDISTQDYSFRSNLLYNPTAEYRRISMTGSQPISHVQVSVHMLLKNGTMIPFFLHPNSSASMKIMFERID